MTDPQKTKENGLFPRLNVPSTCMSIPPRKPGVPSFYSSFWLLTNLTLRLKLRGRSSFQTIKQAINAGGRATQKLPW